MVLYRGRIKSNQVRCCTFDVDTRQLHFNIKVPHILNAPDPYCMGTMFKWCWGGGVWGGGDMIKKGVLREISIYGRYFVVWRVGRWDKLSTGGGDRIIELGAYRMFFQKY